MNKHHKDELGNRYFTVGDKIKVPGELNADDERITSRKDTKGAQSDYVTSGGAAREAAANQEVADRKDITWTEKKYDTFEQIARELFKKEGVENPSDLQLSKRIKDLKKDNPNLKDGQLKGQKIKAGVSKGLYDNIVDSQKQREAAAVSKEDTVAQKESAKQIVADLEKAIKGRNDLKAIQEIIARIDNPVEMAEVNRLLSSKYPADDLYSPIEKFIYEENNHDYVHTYNSTEYMEQTVQKWIQNGTLKGEDAVNAQARMAARVICDGGDGLGTDCDKIKKGIHMIKSPTGNNPADAKAVYDKVNDIISKHSTFYGLGAKSKDLLDYLDGELWDGEVKYLQGVLAQNDAIHGQEKADAVAGLVREAVEGAGTDIEYLEQALKGITSPEDMEAVEAQLKAYCEKKGIKPEIEGQSYLQAILHDECDTFMGLSKDHKEIRKFNEMMITQGAYTPEQVVNLRAEQAALQILDGGLENIQDAVAQIKDPKVLTRLNKLLKTKGFDGIDGYLNSKFTNQTSRDLVKAELAANKLLSDKDAASIGLRLIQHSDYDTRAKGIASIRTAAQAESVDKALKSKGSSLAEVMEKFNAEKAANKKKAAFWDGLASYVPGMGALAEHISDQYRENTDISDNLYVEAKQAATISAEQKRSYDMTVKVLEEKLNAMKRDYQNALDSQGVISGAVNQFCSVYNIGTTRDEIEARIEHDTETVRLLKLASEGKLQKIVDGKTVNVTFEEVFEERQSEFVTANAASISGISHAVSGKPITKFSGEKVQKVEQQAQQIAAMDTAKDYIAQSWQELGSALSSNDNKRLSTAIYSTLGKISQMSGQQLSLDSFGYSMKDGMIVDKSGIPVPASELHSIANKLKQGLSDISRDLLGVEIPLNTNSDNVSGLMDKGYDSKLEQFKQEYRDAFGQDCPDEMIDSYITTINTGTMVANIGVAIGAVIAAPFTGGGSLAVFAVGAAASLTMSGLEHSTDANGWTNDEWTKDFGQAVCDGALGAAGMKVGQLAEAFAKGTSGAIQANKWLAKLPKAVQGKVMDNAVKISQKLESISAKVGQNAVNAQKAKLAARFQNMKPETLDKASLILARFEAAGVEISSDALQSAVQMYCMEGDFNAESFITGMIMSIAGNSAGHVFSAVGDVKNVDGGVKSGNGFDDTAPMPSGNRMSSTMAQARGSSFNPSEIRTGKMQKNSTYLLNNDRLPVLELPGGERIDLNNPNISKELLSLQDGQTFVIGREGNLVTNGNNMRVSRQHVVIYKENGQLKIRDISSNGTSILADASEVSLTKVESGKMVQNQPYLLKENRLPKVNLANSQTINLADYKAQIAALQDGQVLTIGRNGDIKVNGNTISGQHLVIYRSNGQLKIKDVSLNGSTIEINSGNIFNRLKNKIFGPQTPEITPQERSILNKFSNNRIIANAIANNPAEAKKIAARLEKIMKNPSIVSPELKNVIENGKINLGGREGLIDCSLDTNVMNDIAKLAVDGDYIKKYKGHDVSFQQVMANTPLGEVANINGQLFVNNGKYMEKINMSEETFRKLFPPVVRFNTHQGAVGTCYLVSSLERLYSSPLGRAEIYRLIGEDSNGIYTMTHNSNGKKDYFKRWDRFHKHIQEEGGLALIEQGYCKNSRLQGLHFNPRETQIMEINAGGWSENAMQGLIGISPTVVRYNQQEIANLIINNANKHNMIINCGTSGGKGLSDRNALSQKYNLFASHEYSIKGYDQASGCVIISNPWHSGLTTKIPLSEFVKYFNEVSILNIA